MKTSKTKVSKEVTQPDRECDERCLSHEGAIFHTDGSHDCPCHRPPQEKVEEKVIGGKLHKILNNTLHRKLTIKEYQRVIELISYLTTARQAERERIREIVEIMMNKPDPSYTPEGSYLLALTDVLALLEDLDKE